MGESNSKFGKFTPGDGTTACVIDNESDCELACQKILEDCSEHKVVGFDCEWEPDFRRDCDNPVDLVQLATPTDCVFLFRLCMWDRVPPCLRDILEDRKIIKAGVSPDKDREKLRMFGVSVRSILDLRFLYNTPKGLAVLSRDVLQFELDKDNRFRLSAEWDDEELSTELRNYAACDAWVAKKLFLQWALNETPQFHSDSGFGRMLNVLHAIAEPKERSWEAIENEVKKYYDKEFRSIDGDSPNYQEQVVRARQIVVDPVVHAAVKGLQEWVERERNAAAQGNRAGRSSNF